MLRHGGPAARLEQRGDRGAIRGRARHNPRAMPRFDANCSMLFTEMRVLDRFAQAAKAGFDVPGCFQGGSAQALAAIEKVAGPSRPSGSADEGLGWFREAAPGASGP